MTQRLRDAMECDSRLESNRHVELREIENIGFISTRFQGTDGVSLETEKWATVLKRMGYQPYYFAGLSDWDHKRTMIVPEAFFDHPSNREIQSKSFKVYRLSLIHI